MTQPTKVVLYLAGTALLLLSLVYLGISVARNWSTVERARIISLPWLLACAAIYGISHVTTALSWPLALRQLGTHLSIRDGLRIGLVAQIGKYLPGNVAHYAGRGALAKQLGVPLKISGLSTAIELGSALTAAILIGAAGLLTSPRPVVAVPSFSNSSALILVGVLAALAVTWTWLFRRGTRLPLLVGPTLCLAASFSLSGLSVYALSQALGYAEMPVAAAVGAFALAWGLGFIVPGAPAGLGVREAALLTMLGPMIGMGPVAALAILHRLITAVVDGAAALAGYAWLASATLPKK